MHIRINIYLNLIRSSTVVRSYEERCFLLSRANRGKIVTISIKGYVFFGSAVRILEEVKYEKYHTCNITCKDICSHKLFDIWKCAVIQEF